MRVRPWNEIAATLDTRGSLDGLPFMSEMLPYCGRSFTINRRLERTCEEIHGDMRRIRDVVYLDQLRCDGTSHGGCQKGCRFFWKDKWLTECELGERHKITNNQAMVQLPYPAKIDEERYVCQSTELIRATSPISTWNPLLYFRDVRARTYTTAQLLRSSTFAVYLRFRKLISGRSHHVLTGTLLKTPCESLWLRPGEWVRVKSPEEIAATLDQDGKNRGLAFTVAMLPFCGKRLRVLDRVEQLIVESTRRLIQLKDTVILEDATCDGCHKLPGSCPRDTHHFWREIWLRRLT